MKSIYKNMYMNTINNMIIKLPTPINISILWNMGSLLGMCMMIQLISGIFLTMHYSPNIHLSFYSIIHIMHDINYGWLIRLIHMNGASMFFFCVYIHLGRNIYYSSFNLMKVWFIGIFIFFIMMMTAFMGYVLPWGQMSFWGATVITNLVSAIPYIGSMIVEWLWGGFSINNATLNRFYTFHFIMPFIILMFIMLHLIYLHNYGSSNPLGLNSNFYKIKFNNYFTLKDLVGMILMFFILIIFCLKFPYILGDSENFFMANSMITPIHIQPEWYFLFAYSILRSIPNKLSGVIALMMSILILFILPIMKISKFQSNMIYPINKFLFWFFSLNFLFLTWLGMKEVEYPYTLLGIYSSFIYFTFYFLNYWIKLFWKKLIY